MEGFFKMKVRMVMENDMCHERRKHHFEELGGNIVKETKLEDGNFEVIGFIYSNAFGQFLSRNGVVSKQDISEW